MASGTRPKTMLGLFNEKLTEFLNDLSYVFPEERDLKNAIEYVELAKKSNPKLILDMFYDNIYRDAHEMIEKEDDKAITEFAAVKIQTQYNEILPSIAVFTKHWETLDDANRAAIWKYMKVLCVLCERARKA